MKRQEYRFIALGGGNDIGGSCYVLDFGGGKIMLDAGIKYSPDLAERVPDVTPLYSEWGLDGLWELDALVISHAHMDHSGALPVFFRNLHGVNIYSSEATPDILTALYRDNFSRARNKDIAAISDTFIPAKYGVPFKAKNFTVTLYPAGHIPGAAMTLIENDDCSVLFTGDFCTFDQLTVKGAMIPDVKADTLICESTYGYSTSPGPLNLTSTAEMINTLRLHTDTFTCRVRNSGRAAEISAAVCECIRLGLIPEMNVFIGGGCLESCMACEKWGEYSIFGEHVRPADEYSGGRGGMIITGRAVNCQYEFAPVMSNHADSFGILELISRVNPDKVILVHGVPAEDGIHNIPIEIRERFGNNIEVVHSINGRTINLLKE